MKSLLIGVLLIFSSITIAQTDKMKLDYRLTGNRTKVYSLSEYKGGYRPMIFKGEFSKMTPLLLNISMKVDKNGKTQRQDQTITEGLEAQISENEETLIFNRRTLTFQNPGKPTVTAKLTPNPDSLIISHSEMAAIANELVEKTIAYAVNAITKGNKNLAVKLTSKPAVAMSELECQLLDDEIVEDQHIEAGLICSVDFDVALSLEFSAKSSK